MNDIKNSSDELKFSFSNLNDYDDFEIIFEKLQKKFKVEILKKLDGPDMRVWDINIEGKKFQLYNDPYGNYLITAINNANDFENIKKKIINL